jgi:hypothetical protein
MLCNSNTLKFDSTSQEDLSDLESHLRIRLNGRIRQLRLTLRDHGLVIHGQAQTYYAKQMAQVELMETFHVTVHANEIEVDQATIQE